LISKVELSTHCHQSGIERPDCFPALHQPPITTVEDGMRLIEARHSVDVSRPLSGNQQPLQILRITRWLTAYFIAHNDTPLTAIQSN
jgi:hypothetical protein